MRARRLVGLDERYCSNSPTNEISFVDRETPLGAVRHFGGRRLRTRLVLSSPSARATPPPPVTLISATNLSSPGVFTTFAAGATYHPTCQAGKDEVHPSLLISATVKSNLFQDASPICNSVVRHFRANCRANDSIKLISHSASCITAVYLVTANVFSVNCISLVLVHSLIVRLPIS